MGRTKELLQHSNCYTCGAPCTSYCSWMYQIQQMKKKNILLPIDKTVGYITTEEICKDGFELIGFFDGNNVYKKKENE